MRNVLRLVFLLIAVLHIVPLHAQPALDTRVFSQIPILDEGRVKPLETYARVWLTKLYGKEGIADLTAVDWLAELIFDPRSSYQRDVFDIADVQVVDALGLVWKTGHRYTFVEVSTALKPHAEDLAKLVDKPEDQRSDLQNKMVTLYLKMLWYFDVSRSLSLLLPEFRIIQPDVAERLELPLNQPFNYLDMVQKRTLFIELVEGVARKKPEDMTAFDREILGLGMVMRRLAGDDQTQVFRIVPPQWQHDGDVWLAPWEVLQRGSGSPQTAAYLKHWEEMAQAWLAKDAARWDESVKSAVNSVARASTTFVNPAQLKVEVLYRQYDLFKYSSWFYGASFVSLLLLLLVQSRFVYVGGTTLLGIGLLLHGIGIVLRMYIMGRPPVATLYESILFVGFVSVLFAWFWELKKTDKVGLFIASLLGFSLQFTGLQYAGEGDSLGMLIAVLNTNFWLATHVVTITIGYGFCFVTSLLAHVYLYQRGSGVAMSRLNELNRQVLGVGLIALFFTMFGTILGGIWADQSWGRFWGWDPKENGALLIFLWLTFLMHGRISKLFSPLVVNLGMAFTSIIVALAWFGVNLLNVGLHSYGFIQHVATNLLVFCLVQMLVIAGLGMRIWHKERRTYAR